MDGSDARLRSQISKVVRELAHDKQRAEGVAGGRGGGGGGGGRGEQRSRGKRPGAVWARSLGGDDDSIGNDVVGEVGARVPPEVSALAEAVDGQPCPGCGVPLQCDEQDQPGYDACVFERTLTNPSLSPVLASRAHAPEKSRFSTCCLICGSRVKATLGACMYALACVVC
jgi:hypothetical protein